MTPDFEAKLEQYISQITDAHQTDAPERQISHVFLSFISDAFGVKSEDIELEHHIVMSAVRKSGYVDALLGDLIIEFKRNIERNVEEKVEQLVSYMRGMHRPNRYVGMLTDGIRFCTYMLGEEGEAQEVSELTISDSDARTAYLWLDTYLYSRREIAPSADDIVQRFGVNSPTFRFFHQQLMRLHDKVKHSSELQVWRGQWSDLLSKVYGSDIADDELFLRHSYLSQFAKILVFSALSGRPDTDDISRIVEGEAFHKYGISNIGEHDFFAWILMDKIRSDATDLLYELSAELLVFDLSAIQQDLLKQLYQDLVDPTTRHDLGEYYTPDWLAQLVLQEIDYTFPQSLLDPACGSGTFLFNAIRRLAGKGLRGKALVDFALNNIVGMDVHPLAVIIARINYMLALLEHLDEATEEIAVFKLPVFMADALIEPLNRSKLEAITIPVNPERDEHFRIPVSCGLNEGKLSNALQQLDDFAQLAGRGFSLEETTEPFLRVINDIFEGTGGEALPFHWLSNLRLLRKLIDENRDRIWAYILANKSRPLVLAQKRFDVVVGNPPWLSYRFIQSADGQQEIKRLSIHYQLADSSSVTLFTQMDLSTLFFCHSQDQYLFEQGTIAFVMPRSAITGAKQHRAFQRQGFTRIQDLRNVEPLFNVPAAVLIRSGREASTQDIPTTAYAAALPRHEMPLEEAVPLLQACSTVTSFVDSDSKSPYHPRFVVGASLFPRNLCFVRPAGIPSSPAVMTDPELDRAAKPRWKGVRFEGTVEEDYIYATLLSKHLVPFGYQRLHMVALPMQVRSGGELDILNGLQSFVERGHITSYTTWFAKIDEYWERRKKSKMTLLERFDYHRLLSKQNTSDRFIVLYNASGSNLTSCVIESEGIDLSVHKRRTQAFIVDYKTYFYSTKLRDEAHFLCAFLNTDYVNSAIKPYQSQGSYGHRDISRTPFEACNIPLYDPGNDDHCELVRFSIGAHRTINAHKEMGNKQLVSKGRPTARRQAREILADEIAAIDEIARRLLSD